MKPPSDVPAEEHALHTRDLRHTSELNLVRTNKSQMEAYSDKPIALCGTITEHGPLGNLIEESNNKALCVIYKHWNSETWPPSVIESDTIIDKRNSMFPLPNILNLNHLLQSFLLSLYQDPCSGYLPCQSFG